MKIENGSSFWKIFLVTGLALKTLTGCFELPNEEKIAGQKRLEESTQTYLYQFEPQSLDQDYLYNRLQEDALKLLTISRYFYDTSTAFTSQALKAENEEEKKNYILANHYIKKADSLKDLSMQVEKARKEWYEARNNFESRVEFMKKWLPVLDSLENKYSLKNVEIQNYPEYIKYLKSKDNSLKNR